MFAARGVDRVQPVQFDRRTRMNRKDRLPKAIAFACSVALGAAAFAALAGWGYSQLGSVEQRIVSSSGMANGSLYINTTQIGEDHAQP